MNWRAARLTWVVFLVPMAMVGCNSDIGPATTHATEHSGNVTSTAEPSGTTSSNGSERPNKPVALASVADGDDQPLSSEQPKAAVKANAERNTSKCQVIIHADDAGLCHSVNQATIDAMEKGIVSSASIMVPCPAFEEFAKYAREHPERDFGIHLTLNAEFRDYPWRPVLPANEVPGLVTPEGYLWPDGKQTVANARADEVERELTAQIERAKKLGVRISHLDTHMGTLLTRSDFLEVYANLGIKYGVPICFTRDPKVLKKFPIGDDVPERGDGVVRALDEHRLPLLDDVFMHYVNDGLEKRREFYLDTLRGLKPGVYQLIIHCSYDGADIGRFTGTGGMRDMDRQIFMDPATAREVDRLNIQVVNWKQLSENVASQKQTN